MFAPKILKKFVKSQLSPNFGLGYAGIRSPAARNPSRNNPAIQFCLNEVEQYKSAKIDRHSNAEKDSCSGEENAAQISHPWSEWVDLMNRLVKNGYFDEIGNPFLKSGILGHKEAKSIRTACLNFARDHYQLIRYLPYKDIQVIAESGCPSTDRKVVNSGKRLRAHVQVEEGNVCSTCILRGNCDRAYVTAHEAEGGRTTDVMRILLTYGLDTLGSVEDKPCLNKKVQESVRSLLKAMAEIKIEGRELKPERREQILSERNRGEDDVQRKVGSSMKSGDWICPKCNFQNFARNMKCLRCNNVFLDRLRKLSMDQKDLPLKKGDWICDKCNMLNFARNTQCFQCEEKPPKRKLILGEWECDSCNYINFRRNMLCLKCDHPRPIASKTPASPCQPTNRSWNNRAPQPWFLQTKQQVSTSNGDRTFRFIDDEWEVSERSWNDGRLQGFMEFPIAGGKSTFSKNVKMQMGDGSETLEHGNRVEHGGRYKYPSFLQSDDEEDEDENEMAHWFAPTKNT